MGACSWSTKSGDRTIFPNFILISLLRALGFSYLGPQDNLNFIKKVMACGEPLGPDYIVNQSNITIYKYQNYNYL